MPCVKTQEQQWLHTSAATIFSRSGEDQEDLENGLRDRRAKEERLKVPGETAHVSTTDKKGKGCSTWSRPRWKEMEVGVCTKGGG